jgi:hypothetical protein
MTFVGSHQSLQRLRGGGGDLVHRTPEVRLARKKGTFAAGHPAMYIYNLVYLISSIYTSNVPLRSSVQKTIPSPDNYPFSIMLDRYGNLCYYQSATGSHSSRSGFSQKELEEHQRQIRREKREAARYSKREERSGFPGGGGGDSHWWRDAADENGECRVSSQNPTKGKSNRVNKKLA